jgi:transcription-repair coupling factor (superfamily II helicase)
VSLSWVLPVLRESAEYDKGLARLRSGGAPADAAAPGRVWIEGLAANAKWFVAAALAHDLGAPLLVVTASEETAERLVEDLPALGWAREQVGLYPASDPGAEVAIPEEKILASSDAAEQRELMRGRLAVLEGLASGQIRVVVAPIQAALRRTIGPVAENQFVLRLGATLKLDDTARWMAEAGYERVSMVEAPGQFAVRGGILDVFPATRTEPVRLELFGDEVDSLREFDLTTQRSTRELPEVTLVPAAEALASRANHTLLDHLAPDTLVVLDEPNHLKARWDELKEQQTRRRQALAASEKVVSEEAAASLDDRLFLRLDEFAAGVERFRIVFFTLLAHQVAWLKTLVEHAERLSINSGVVDSVHGDIPELSNRLRSLLGIKHLLVVVTDQPHRLAELLAEHEVPVRVGHESRVMGHESTAGENGASAPDEDGPEDARPATRDPRPATSDDARSVVTVTEGRFTAGLRLPGVKLVVITDAEVFGERKNHLRPQRTQQRSFKQGRPITSLLELKEGDLVVHVSHGIGR